jgi:hypothetical protein
VLGGSQGGGLALAAAGRREGVLGQLGEKGRVHLEQSENVARRAGIQPADRRPDAP